MKLTQAFRLRNRVDVRASFRSRPHLARVCARMRRLHLARPVDPQRGGGAVERGFRGSDTSPGLRNLGRGGLNSRIEQLLAVLGDFVSTLSVVELLFRSDLLLEEPLDAFDITPGKAELGVGSFKPRSDVDGVAVGGVIEETDAAEIPDKRQSGMRANPSHTQRDSLFAATFAEGLGPVI